MHDYDTLLSRVTHGYSYEENEGVGFFRSTSFTCENGINHGFSARKGGVSEGPYASLNLSYGRPEPRINVRKNFEIFSHAANIAYDELAIVSYEHGANVLRVTAADCGRGLEREALPFADSLITNDPGVTLVTSHADCGAYFIYDPVHRAVGMAHAGWKGTFYRIGQRTIELMGREFGTQPEDVLVSTGPCICVDCFEVDAELAYKFEKEFSCSSLYKSGISQDKKQLDLSIPAAIQFFDAGVRPENINLMDACTYELSDLLFSHRRDKGVTGSMAAYIKLI